jgi:hypothetical protein
MGLKVSSKGTNGGGGGDVPAVGSHHCRIVAVIDLGTHPETYQGKSVGDRRKLLVVFEFTTEKDMEGRHKILARDYSVVGGDKAGLPKLCSAALAILGPEPEDGWDVARLPGAAVCVAIKQNTKGYRDIDAVTPLLPDVRRGVPKPQNVPFYWDLDDEADYQDHDWIPWVFSKAAGKRVPVSEMIAASRERTGGMPQPAMAGAGAGQQGGEEAF